MSEGNDDKWEMPKPVFRSSTGALPKSFEETISQSFSPDSDTVEIDEDDDILGVLNDLPTEPANKDVDKPTDRADLASQPVAENTVRAKAPSPPPKRGGMSMAVVFVLIALLAAAIVAVYYFVSRAPSDSTFQ